MKQSEYRPELVNGNIIYIDELDDIFNELICLKPHERIIKYPCIEKGREDLIIPGLLILKNVLDITGINSFVVSDGGIKEGLVYYKH